MGKCRDKGWVWRKGSIQGLVFPKTERIGTCRCVVESKVGFGEADQLGAESIKGFVKSASNRTRFAFYISGSEDKREDITNYTTLKASLEVLEDADFAIIGVKKSKSQVVVSKCGSKP